MNNELLRESIDRATSDPTTPPDIGHLMQRGRRRSAVRTGAAVLATLGVVVGGTYTVQGIDGSGTSGQPPVSVRSYGPAIAYVNGSHVRFGDQTHTANHAEHLGMSAATDAGLVYIGDDSMPYLMSPNGDETALGDSLNPDGAKYPGTSIMASADRNTVVWSAVYDGKLHLSMFDASTANVTATTTLDCREPSRCGAIQSVDDGIVAVTMATPENDINLDYTYAWEPSRPKGKRLYPMTDSGTVIAAIGDGHIVLDGDGPAYGGPDRERLDPSIEVSRLPKGQYAEDVNGQMSADGRWRLLNDSKALALNVETGQRARLAGGDSSSTTFDDDGSVLVIAKTDEGHRLIDCDPATDQCVTIDGALEGDDPAFPGEDAS